MTQRLARGFVPSSQVIHEEYIFPRPSLDWPRFNLAQVDIAQRKHTQRFKKRSRDVLQRKGYRRLVRSRRYLLVPSKQEKTRVVLLIVLEPRLDDLSAINLRRPPTGYPGSICHLL